MKIKITIIVLSILALLIWVSMLEHDSGFSKLITREKQTSNPNTFNDRSFANCENFAVIISASKLARKMGVTKDWIIQNYQVPVYADTVENSNQVIGHAPPGGHCFIVEQDDSWFFIQTPGSNELGWLDKKYVVGFVKKDPITLLPCPGRM